MRVGGGFRLIAMAAVLACLSAWTAGSAGAKQASLVGANLPRYVAPKKGACDIRVPNDFSTIQAAVDASSTGDTVCVGPGTYQENVRIEHPVKLAGSGPTKSIIVGQGNDSTVMTDQDGSVNNFLIEGFQIRGADASGDPNAVALNIGSFSSEVTVRYNWIVAGSGRVAVRADSGQTNELFTNNVLEGLNSPEILQISGVQGPSGEVDILNNTFAGTVDAGIVLDTWATNSSISRNTFDTGNDVNVVVGSAYASNHVNQNNFNANAPVMVANYSAGNLDATNNWWGDLNPSDNISGGVATVPFASQLFRETTSCYGQIFAVTVPHDLTIEGSCDLQHATISGDVAVGRGGTFSSFDSQITGDVTARNAAWVGIGFYDHIFGSLRVTGSSDLTGLWRTTVDGDVTLSGNSGAFGIEGANVAGDLTVSKNSLPADPIIIYTSVHGDADIRNNHGASLSLIADGITGTLNCKNNNPPVTLDPTTSVGEGTGECAQATPPPTP
jgi:hypothetical protein